METSDFGVCKDFGNLFNANSIVHPQLTSSGRLEKTLLFSHTGS